MEQMGAIALGRPKASLYLS